MEDQSPQYLLSKLDNLLAESAQQSVEPGHGSDYVARMNEAKKVWSQVVWVGSLLLSWYITPIHTHQVGLYAAHDEKIYEAVVETICRILE